MGKKGKFTTRKHTPCEIYQNRPASYFIINFTSTSATHQSNHVTTVNYFIILPNYDMACVKIERHKPKLSIHKQSAQKVKKMIVF